MNIPSGLDKWFWAVVPGLLMLAGAWLAKEYSKTTSQLYFSAQRSKVGDTFVIDFKILNRSSQAIDELVVTPPTTGLVIAAYEPSSSEVTQQDKFKWRRYLPAKGLLRGVLVYQNTSGPASEQILELIKARSQLRRAPEGKLEWTSMAIQQGDTTVFFRTTISFLLYIGPIFLFGVVILIIHVIGRRRQAKRTGREQPVEEKPA